MCSTAWPTLRVEVGAGQQAAQRFGSDVGEPAVVSGRGEGEPVPEQGGEPELGQGRGRADLREASCHRGHVRKGFIHIKDNQ